MNTLTTGLTVFFGTITLLFLTTLILALPTFWLWNWLMPVIFSVKEITFWQAWGLNFLSGVLFKSYTSSKGN